MVAIIFSHFDTVTVFAQFGPQKSTLNLIIFRHFDTSSFCPVLGQFDSIIKNVWISMKLCKKITI